MHTPGVAAIRADLQTSREVPESGVDDLAQVVRLFVAMGPELLDTVEDAVRADHIDGPLEQRPLGSQRSQVRDKVQPRPDHGPRIDEQRAGRAVVAG